MIFDLLIQDIDRDLVDTLISRGRALLSLNQDKRASLHTQSAVNGTVTVYVQIFWGFLLT